MDFLNPLLKEDIDYKIEKVSKENKWSRVSFEKDHIFMHSGEINAPELIFSVKNSSYLKIDFSIKNGSKVGDILFKVYKNDNHIGNFNALAEQEKLNLNLFVTSKDTLKIIADKNGKTGQDWGIVEIKSIDILKTVLYLSSICFWIVFLILSYKKNQASITISTYLVFILTIYAERISIGVLDSKIILAYTSIFLILALLLTLMYNILKNKLSTVITIFSLSFLSILPLVFIVYEMSFKIPLGKEELFAIFQTNNNEGVEFISDFIPTIGIIFFILSLLTVIYIIWWHRKNRVEKFETSNIMILFLSLVIILITYSENMRLINYVYDTYYEYSKELNEFRKLQEKRKTLPIKAEKDEKGETYIVIIGESLNKTHMSLYGYARDTNPKMLNLYKNNDILKFTNTYSNHTHTMPTLSLALTEASQENGKEYFNSASIIGIYNSAGFETTWLTNQSLLGAWDNLVSIIAQQSNKVYALNKSVGKTTKTQNYDGVLLPNIEKELNIKSDKNRVIFVHLMGSHGGYCSRFPNEYSLFESDLDIDTFGKAISSDVSLKNSINCYDNSVVYNDYIVSSIINEAKKYEGVSALLYFSDHADDVISKLGHNSGKFTFDMTQIPFIAWFSDEYKEKYKTKFDNLEQNQDKLFPNDRIYDTLIGISNIKTNLYNKEFDFSSSSYKIDEHNSTTLHGKRKYSENSNQYFWQKKNFEFLKNNHLEDKFFPHRVNSFGKLKDVWELGYRSFEVDMVFDYKKDGKFYVGHNDGVMGTDLESFLKSVDYKQINRMWFDFKNLNKNNYKEAFVELERLNSIFDLKNKVILETSWKDEEFKKFSESSWHTSYYLPTGTMKNLLDNQDIKGLEDLANNISKQILNQDLKAVSFDNKYYEFVKKYLEPKISNEIVYHSWYGPAINSDNLEKQIKDSFIYNDSRIKTFLCSFKTNFNL